MDNIYDTLAKLNEVANRPEAKKIVKEDSHGMMKKGLRDLIDKSSKMNKQSTYKPFGKDDPDYETGLSKDSKKDKMFSEAEADNTDRSSVTLDMVAPALKKLHMEYKEKANEYHTAYAEMEADGMSDEEIMNADDDIVGYVNIDDIEDKIKAIEEVFKEGNFGEVNGNNIIAMASSGDTAMRELFMQELKYAIKDNHPDVYSKLFMYGIGESKNESVEEASVEEASVEVPVQELQDILQLAGFENYAEKIEEYANEPNEEYGDSEEQMVGLSGGLNGPKTHYPAAAGGDNPMNVKPLKVDDVYESFYTKYDKFIAELNNQNK